MGKMITSFTIIITIINRGKEDKLAVDLTEHGAMFNVFLRGHGTAEKKILSYLGLGETEKSILVSGVPLSRTEEFMTQIASKLHLKKAGKGITFAIPVLGNGQVTPGSTQVREEISMSDITNNLIISVMNHGYADEIMDTARDAGAPGGTILRARGAGYKMAEKFLGITIQPDKDLLMILAPQAACKDIVNAILSHNKDSNDANAIAFCLPVSHIAGITDMDQFNGSNGGK